MHIGYVKALAIALMGRVGIMVTIWVFHMGMSIMGVVIAMYIKKLTTFLSTHVHWLTSPAPNQRDNRIQQIAMDPLGAPYTLTTPLSNKPRPLTG